MAQNHANGTGVQPRAARPAWPGNSVRGVEMDARAVEAEAYAVEREAGGWPFVGATFDDLRQAAQDLSELCEALQAEDLDDEQRQLLADVAPKVEALAAELSGESPDAGTVREVLAAAEQLKELCNALRGQEPDKDWQFLDNELFPAIDKLINNIRSFEQGRSAGKAERPAAEARPRSEKK